MVRKTRTWRSQHSQGEEGSLHLQSKLLCNWSQDQRYNLLNTQHRSDYSGLKALVFKVFDSRMPAFSITDTSPSWLNCQQQTITSIPGPFLDLVPITSPVLLDFRKGFTSLKRKMKALPSSKAKSVCDQLFHAVATRSDTVAGLAVLQVRQLMVQPSCPLLQLHFHEVLYQHIDISLGLNKIFLHKSQHITKC